MITTTDFAELLGVSQTMIRKYRKLGMPGPKDAQAQGQYYFVKAIRWLANRGKKRENKEVGLTEARIRLTLAQAEREEISNKITKKDLIPLANAERVLAGIFGEIKCNLMALPGKLSPRLENVDQITIKQTLNEEIRAALNESNAKITRENF